jgi:hypothetical protein
MRALSFESKEYMDAHIHFRKKVTNQGELILEYLKQKLAGHIKSQSLDCLRLASIGSGTGIIEVPLVDYLQSFCPISFLGIEPNEHENKMAKAAMEKIALEHSKFDFYAGSIEDFETDIRSCIFNAVIGVHVTYYTDDIRSMLNKALSLLHPKHGILIMVVSDNTPQNELFIETTEVIHGFKPVMANAFRGILEDLGLGYQEEKIEAKINITSFIKDPKSQNSKKFLDFFLHADSSSLTKSQKEKYIKVIKQNLTNISRRFYCPISQKHLLLSQQAFKKFGGTYA